MLTVAEHHSAISAFLSSRIGQKTRLRLASEDDAKFILSLRLDPTRNHGISSTSDDIAAQLKWMTEYAKRHAAGLEDYFIIETSGQAQGTLRFYDYTQGGERYRWGSWILRPGAPSSAAFQSLTIAYDLAFGPLKFIYSNFEVKKANISVWKFHERTGAKLVGENTDTRFYEYTNELYAASRPWLQRFANISDDA